jgi:hypothetical protein
MPDLATQIRTYLDDTAPPVTSEEIFAGLTGVAPAGPTPAFVAEPGQRIREEAASADAAIIRTDEPREPVGINFDYLWQSDESAAPTKRKQLIGVAAAVAATILVAIGFLVVAERDVEDVDPVFSPSVTDPPTSSEPSVVQGNAPVPVDEVMESVVLHSATKTMTYVEALREALREEMLRDEHLLIADHTRRHLRSEHHFPGPVIERANLPRWQEEGSTTLGERAHREVQRHLSEYEPSRLSDDVKKELVELMSAEAKRHGMEKLPDREL